MGGGPEVFRRPRLREFDGRHQLVGVWARVVDYERVADWQEWPCQAMRWFGAQGYTGGGYWPGSGWFIENVAPVLAPPLMLGDAVKPNTAAGQFNFTSHATPGQLVVLQATSDFITWTPLQTNSAGASGTVTFSDPQTGVLPKRFYRAVVYPGRKSGRSR